MHQTHDRTNNSLDSYNNQASIPNLMKSKTLQATRHLPHTQHFSTNNRPSEKTRLRPIGLVLTFATVVAALIFPGLSARAQTVAYTADVAGPFGGAGNNAGLNMGHTFTVTGSGIKVFSLGVYDYQGNGLNAAHIVALFSGSGSGSTPVAGGSVTVPSGTTAPLTNGFRMTPLAAPVTLAAGNYSVIVYQMNGGGGSDGYAEANNTGFIGDGNVSYIAGTFNFDSASYPTYPYENSAGNLASCSFTYLPILAATDYAPITLTPGSYNEDAIVELGAPHPPASVTTATMDSGTGNTGTTWYEVGANSSDPSSGIPLHGSTFASLSLPDHTYTMPPNYHVNNAVLIDGTVTSATIAIPSPAACSSLSFLVSSGNGATTFGYTVHHADSTLETGTFAGGDWFGGALPAIVANGRVSVPNSFSTISGNPRIYSADVVITNTASPVTSIDLTHASGTGHGLVFAVSRSTGSGFSPMTITGFNADVVVEATGALNGAYTTVSMDSGTGNSGFSWYERGYDTAAVTTGIPNAGSTISSSTAPDHYYTFAPSYAANDVGYIDSSHSATLTPATPDAFSALSFLTSAGHGPVTIDYNVDHADGTTETGTFNSPDWFFNTPVAFTANGRVDVSSGTLDNVNNNEPLIYYEDVALGNTQSQVTRVRLNWDPGNSGSGDAVVFALSGVATFTSPTAPFNAVAAPATQTQYVGGVASFSVSASGSTPFTYQWWKGPSLLTGKTSSTLTLSGLASGDAGSYTCVVSNATGSTATSTAAVLSVLALPQGVSGTLLSDLPLAYYRFNELGPLVTEVATNSGSLGAAGNDTHFPGMTHQVPGALAGSSDSAAGYTGIDKLSCDGGVPTRVPFNAAFNTGTFAVEAWVMPTISGTANAQTPLYNRKEDSPRTGWVIFQRADSTQPTGGPNQPTDRGWNFRAYNGVDTDRSIDLTGGSYIVGTWSHLVITFDGTTATMYVNGENVASQTVVGSYAPNTDTIQFCVGGYFDASQNPFTGSIDEVALYSTALADTTVQAHYQNGTNASRSTPYESLVTTDGAVEYLRLDEPARNVAVNVGSLGALANGAYANTTIGAAGPQAPLFPGFGAGNLAASFDGTNTYVEIENPPGLNFTGPITLEAWIQPAASQNSEAYIIAHGYNDTGTGEDTLRIENGNYSIGSYNGSGHGTSFAVPAGDLSGTAWVHLVGTYDGANWNLYRNGALVASAGDTTGAVVVDNANWAIGARGRWKRETGLVDPGQDTRMFNGVIDEAAIYNYALTAS